LIEEYFDGEATAQTGEQIRAHLSACADCAAALDALSFEQEIYARYDRGGLEVTPDLWARVSAEIARTPPTEVPAERRPFLSRALEGLTAALGVLAARPALASSLALLVVAAAAATLWLSRRPQPQAPAQPEVARQSVPTPTAAVIPTGPDIVDDNPKRENPFNEGGGITVQPADEPRVNAREAETALNVSPARPGGGAGVSVDELLAPSSAPKDDPRVVKFKPEHHGGVDDTAALFVNASAPARDVVTADARLLDPGEKDVARHVERAQMLLRSIKNVRAGDAGEPDISYEKNLSRKLLAENATLQLEAEVKGDKETKQVLDRIEPFLLDIANMGEKPSREEVRSIRERVRSNEIVAALEVY
jgi:hypothetical protein